MTGIISGIRYVNHGRVTVCASSWGLFGPAKWRWQSIVEFINFVRSNGGTIVSTN